MTGYAIFMKACLTSKDILALGFMAFALFVGAGNIIFPIMLGIQSGEYVWIATAGFLLTAVGLPIITMVALARVGGSIDTLSLPIGKRAGLILAAICYLSVGPLFATPRTCTVSFSTGIASWAGDGALPLLIYSVMYFVVVSVISLYPGKLLDSVGYVLAPVKILALTVLSIAALFWPAGAVIPATEVYQTAAFSSGFIKGYLTMDTLAAMVFGIVIVNAVRSRGISDPHLLTRYLVIAGGIAGIGLILVYLSLAKLGNNSGELIAQSAGGPEILYAYVQKTFGIMGSSFLALLIFVACIVTAVGLTCACAEFFAQHLPLSYRTLILILGGFSMLVSNLGLAHLTNLSAPFLVAIYPPCIVLVLLSFSLKWWHHYSRIVIPVMLVSLLFGIIDALKGTAFHEILPDVVLQLPLAEQKLSWLLPSLIVFVLAAGYDRLTQHQRSTS